MYNDTAHERKCVTSPGAVYLYDGTIFANVINNHHVIDLPLDVAVRHTIGMPLSAFDVVVANQGNIMCAFRAASCPGGPDHLGDRRVLPVDTILSALELAGFRGHLFMVSDRMWRPIDSEVSMSLQKAEANGLPFSVHTSLALDSNHHEVVRTCGRAEARGRHACIPGPTLWMIEIVRAQYAAYVGSNTRKKS